MSEYKQNKSWFSRNWLWFVPLGGCLTVILLFVFGIGAAIFGITNLVTHSTPYEYALEEAKNNALVIEQLGDPVKTNGIMKGNISLDNNKGEADFTIPIKGPENEGHIKVVAYKSDGVWEYEKLYVTIKDSEVQINLLDKSLEGI